MIPSGAAPQWGRPPKLNRMRVQVLRSFASAGFAWRVGDVYEIAEAQALPWIQAGLIQALPEEPRTATVTAPVETAVTRKGRR